MKRLFVLMAIVALLLIATDAQALVPIGDGFRVTTADAGGADAELRESAPTTNYGASTEIASRVASNRNSLIYLKFGVADLTAADLAGDITIRTTYRNTNLSAGRIQDTVEPIGPNTGWDYYVLNPDATGANWDESTIAPTTEGSLVQAPAYTYDGDFGTSPVIGDAFTGDVHPDLTYLGEKLYDSADLVGGHLPVGGAFDFTLGAGSALHDAIVAAQATSHQTLTIVMTIAHDNTSDNTQWLGFNYLFNPKEIENFANNDPTSPWFGMNNLNDDFSPMLTNQLHIPEPATMALLGLGGLLLRRKRQ